MAWLAVDEDGCEYIYNTKPYELGGFWYNSVPDDKSIELHFMELPNGTIEKLVGRKLTWKDEPVELK